MIAHPIRFGPAICSHVAGKFRIEPPRTRFEERSPRAHRHARGSVLLIQSGRRIVKGTRRLLKEVPTLVRLTGERGRGCNGSCRLVLSGSEVPARGCCSMETTSSVPRTSCFIFGPKAAGSVGRSHRRFAEVIDNTVETSTRVRTPYPARQGGSMARARPVNRGPAPALRSALSRGRQSRLQEGNFSCPPDRI